MLPSSGKLFPLALVATLIVVALAAGLGLREPMPPDEPRFVLAAHHMVDSGDWLFPHRGRELYGEKPPMFMWFVAAAYTVVGDWQVAFLLPSLLAALLTLVLTWDIGRRLWNPRIGRYAALALFVSLQFGLQAKRAQIDMVLVAMTTASLWALLRVMLRGDRRGWLLSGGFLAGLGTVTKGVGFLPLLLLPLDAATRRWVADRHRTGRIAPIGWGLVLAGFLVAVAVWLVPMLWTVHASNDPALTAYARDMLFKQTGQRYANPWHHVRPAWYYLQVMGTLWLPGVLLLPWLLPAWWRRLRRRDRRFALLLGWGVLVLVFFTLSPGKREVYIFPALPAFCLAAAPLLGPLCRRASVRGVLIGYLWLLLVAAALLAAYLLADPGGRASALAERRGVASSLLPVLGVWLAALAFVVLAIALLQLRAGIGRAVLSAAVALWVTVGIGLAPALSGDASAKTLMRRASALIGPDAELALVAWREQMLLQAGRPVQEFGFRRDWHEQWRDAGSWLALAPARRWVLVRADALGPCPDPTRILPAGRANRQDWVLVPGDALAPDCVPPPFNGPTSDGGNVDD